MTDLTAAADLLTRLNRWRKGGRGEMPDPRKITAAIDTAILALKIANAAKEWRDAEQAKAQAKRRFADAVAACVNHPASRRETEKEYAEGASHANVTVWLIVRVRTEMGRRRIADVIAESPAQPDTPHTAQDAPQPPQ